MKNILLLLCTIALLTSCGNKDANKGDATDAEQEHATREMPILQLTDSLQADKHLYVYTILREANSELPTVKDDLGDEYRDNTITLEIMRDGKAYFSKTFTKSVFAQSLEEDFVSNAILDGIRFMRHEPGSGLVFSFAVSYPDSDMSVPFLVTISDNGNYTFEKYENLDREEGDTIYFMDEGV